MIKYTIFCTEEQTKKAFELGAPLEKPDSREIFNSMKFKTFEEMDDLKDCVIINYDVYLKPTAEQMIGWLEEKNIYFDYGHPEKYYGMAFYGDASICPLLYGTYKEVTCAMIDIALDYLINTKEE